MINTIIFDIGNVLAAFCWQKFYKQFNFSDEVYQKLANATVLNKDWNEFDKSALTEEEILNLFIENAPSIETEIREVYKDFNGTIEVFDYTLDWIKHFKNKGFKVLILSNFSSKQYRECADKLYFLKEVDGAVLSFKEKLIKPDDAIYQLIINRYDLVPNQCIFIDDREENISAAIKNRINGIVFKSFEQANTDINKLINENT